MSFPRLTVALLPLALGLPVLLGACSAPLVVPAAASYGADGASLVETGKTSTDHFASMVSKKDCALWRVFKNQDVCRERDSDHDPYRVNYGEPFRQQTEGGVQYTPPMHAAANAPAMSWNSDTYTPSATPMPAVAPPSPPAADPAKPQVAQGDAASPPAAAADQAKPAKPRAHSAKMKKKPVKPPGATQPSANQPTAPTPGPAAPAP